MASGIEPSRESAHQNLARDPGFQVHRKHEGFVATLEPPDVKRWPWLSVAIVVAIASAHRTAWLDAWADIGDTYAGVLVEDDGRDLDFPEHRDANAEWGGGD